ncbi:DUF2721 domain-containing protein [soil metagenome]
MEITLTTPALLFPAISLLLLAFTNRFIALAGLIRGLKKRYSSTHSPSLIGQIENLRERLILIRNMQGMGIFSMFLTVLSMVVLYAEEITWGKYLFGASLLTLLLSLALSLREIQISVKALNLELNEFEEEKERYNAMVK